MRKIAILAAMALLIPVASCEKEETEKELSVSIENVNFDGNDLTFTLVSQEADELQYCVGLFDSPQVGFVHVDPLPSQEVKVQGVIADEKYIILAKASNAEGSVEDAYILETTYSTVPYVKKILVSKFTGTWCGYCPQMTAALEELEEKYPGGFVITALHGSDDFETPATKPLEDKFFISGYPTAVIDYTYTSTQQMLMLEDSFAKTLNANKAVCGLGLQTGIEGDMLSVEVDAEFGAAGNYRICVLVTEDGVKSSETIGSLNGDGIYNDVVRTFLTDTEGDEIGSMRAGSEKKLVFEKKLNSSWDISKLEVVAYILKENKSGKYTVNNLNSCIAGGSAEIAIEQ